MIRFQMTSIRGPVGLLEPYCPITFEPFGNKRYFPLAEYTGSVMIQDVNPFTSETILVSNTQRR